MAESSSASTSTSTSTVTNSKYDVFINHRGKDAKKTLASHTYRRLLSHGLKVFLDQPELRRGDNFPSQIECAIRSASVHVAIFSRRYAESAWCLNELLLMQESNSPIIPVFYHVKPAELRWTKGTYAQDLENSGYDVATVEKWKKALSDVAEISGFELEASNGDEGELVDKVVEGVLKKVKKPALDVAKYPTGLDDKIKDFENTVLSQRQHNGKPHILGIVGLGGIGKTTLAKEFFNRKSSHYGRSCFLFNVRDYGDKGTLNLLQMELLRKLTGSGIPIVSVHEGITILKKHIASPNVLVVLDDVDKVDQVYALLPDPAVFDSDSLILITSRNKNVLISSGVQEWSIYNLTGLSTQHSLELFCLHSFTSAHPPPAFESLVKKFLKACAGLPLSLKVIGALLNGRDTFYWEDQLNKLARILPDEIKQKLQISYDVLDREEKQMFLDIACFFIGEDRDMAVRIWDNGLCGFRNIQDKCLAEVDGENKIKMHDQLRDMGREIANASGLPRRLWNWTRNDMDELVQQSSVIDEVRGIRMLDHTDSHDICSELPWYQRIPELFGNCLMELCNIQHPGICMSKLQLLDTENVLVDNILTKVQSPHLIWLRWNKCPYTSLPSSISMKHLRVLQVRGGELKTLWQKESQAPLMLRELIVDAPLSDIPKSIGQLKHLERIVIGELKHLPRYYRSSSLVPLTKLPEEFCLLQSLKVLVLKECQKIKSLPECFGNLTNLRHIQLSRCIALESLPQSFGNLIKLQRIMLSHCSAFVRLPESFGNLTNLQHIELFSCRSLERLPYSFSKLIKLQYLDLEDCTNLTMSSKALGNISMLEYISLRGCGKIEELPLQVTHQRWLKHLCLEGTNLKKLPSAIGKLNDLKVLYVGDPLLETLPPSLGDLRNLNKLWVKGCKALQCLPASLGQLTQLSELWVDDCPLIRELPFKKEPKGARETLNDLDSSFQNIILPPLLEELIFNGTGISDVSFATGVCFSLRWLYMESSHNLVEVGTLPNTLSYLGIRDSPNLRKIDNLYGLAKLETLDLEYCTELEELPSTEALVSLRRLYVSGCVKVKSIWGLGQLTKLQLLHVNECLELEELQDIEHCMSLQRVEAKGCPKLQWSEAVVEQLRQRCSVLFN